MVYENYLQLQVNKMSSINYYAEKYQLSGM